MSNTTFEKLLEELMRHSRESLSMVGICRQPGERYLAENYFLPHYLNNRILISSLPPCKNWPEVFYKWDPTGSCLFVSLEPIATEDTEGYFPQAPSGNQHFNPANN